jgi:hypothetical protein
MLYGMAEEGQPCSRGRAGGQEAARRSTAHEGAHQSWRRSDTAGAGLLFSLATCSQAASRRRQAICRSGSRTGSSARRRSRGTAAGAGSRGHPGRRRATACTWRACDRSAGATTGDRALARRDRNAHHSLSESGCLTRWNCGVRKPLQGRSAWHSTHV